ncbi:MerR family transcriptional regulator [Corynebacterium sp.]|uniref:MerR family transcriptional regulator n=1 Tax=Corynebacterium sp. TaxID=1720 RepID=UPI002A913D8C|nr:MerR family transcriptional regulator [Corynebacterium sp.]MDY5785293.1 MerR family transcriptional regulator [Corynebacterium sp.]
MHLISDAARALGVTTKALRHWDALGLLVPQRRGSYRVYSEEDLRRGAAIALFQSAGVPLAEMGPLLDAPPADVLTAALRRHRRTLQARARTLKQQVQAVDRLIEEATMEELSEYMGEHMPEHQREAERTWGATPEWESAQKRLRSAGAEGMAAFGGEQAQLGRILAAAHARGVEPGSDEANEIVERHRASLAQWYPVTTARQLILARMYVADARFHEAYGGEQEYLLGLVEKRAEQEGVDTANPAWD